MEAQAITTEQYVEALERLKKAGTDRILALSSIGALSIGGINFMETFADGGISQITDVIGDAISDDGIFDMFDEDISELNDELFFLGIGLSAWGLISKGIKSGIKSEENKKENMKELKKRIESAKKDAPSQRELNQDEYQKFVDKLQSLVLAKKLTIDESSKYLRQVEMGTMPLQTSLKILNRM